jgi:hypothetical protein
MSALLDFLILRSSAENSKDQSVVPDDKKASWPRRVVRFLWKGLREVGLVLEAVERQKRSGRNGMSHRTPYDYPNVRGLQ